jgi:hypothetical protein
MMGEFGTLFAGLQLAKAPFKGPATHITVHKCAFLIDRDGMHLTEWWGKAGGALRNRKLTNLNQKRKR